MFSKSIALLFLLMLGFLTIEQGLAVWIIASYCTFSLLTFVLYGLDKRHAIKGRWRISEKSLQLWALVGGWPGALLAQQMFRHKSQKRAFIVVLWLAIMINASVFIYYLYESKYASS